MFLTEFENGKLFDILQNNRLLSRYQVFKCAISLSASSDNGVNPSDRNCQGHPMWSKLGSAHAQHWLSQGSKEKTSSERGAFEAALCCSGLGWGPTNPCYPEETVLSAERCRVDNSLSI